MAVPVSTRFGSRAWLGVLALSVVCALGSPLSPAAAGTSGLIRTVAGGTGSGKALTVGQFPVAVAAGQLGRLYIADSGWGVVRRVAGKPLKEAVVAGNGTKGFAGDGGPAVNAEFGLASGLGSPDGVALDAAGDVIVADNENHRVRIVAASTGTLYGLAVSQGDIYTVAGNGAGGFAGDGGPAATAELSGPQGVAVDGAGNLVIADTGNARVRVVARSTGTAYGLAVTAGDIYTLAGGTGNSLGDGGPATAAALSLPSSPALDDHGNVVFADVGHSRVRVVAVSDGTFYGVAMTAGDIYTVAGTGTSGFSGDGGPATAATLNLVSVAADKNGNIAIADRSDTRVRVVAGRTGTLYGVSMARGDIYTVAGTGTSGFSGDGGAAPLAQLSTPYGVAFDNHDNLVVADTWNGRVRVAAATSGTFYGMGMTAGDIYTVAGTDSLASSGDGGPATAAEIFYPAGVAVDSAGNVVIADTRFPRIRVKAVSTGTFYGLAMTAGDIYTVAGSGDGYAGDGGPAAAAMFKSPSGVAVDHHGNLLIADAGNDRVRAVAGSSGTFYGIAMTAGDVYTVAGAGTPGYSGDGGAATSAQLYLSSGITGIDPFLPGVAVDGAGNIVIVDRGNSRVRVVAAATGTFYATAMTVGNIYTVAGNGINGFSGDGGAATAAELLIPHGVAVDGNGNLLIADTYNRRVRVLAATTGISYGMAMTGGDIYTVAGNGTGGFSGDGGPATAASMIYPIGVASDRYGNLIIADPFGYRIRVVAGATGSFYGVNMTSGDIYTVTADGTCGFSGDGVAGASSEVCGASAVVIDKKGRMLFADAYSHRIQTITP